MADIFGWWSPRSVAPLLQIPVLTNVVSFLKIQEEAEDIQQDRVKRVIKCSMLNYKKAVRYVTARCGGRSPHTKQELSSSWDGRPWPQQTWAEKRGVAVPLSRRAGTRLIQCGLSKGLLPYQVAYVFIYATAWPQCTVSQKTSHLCFAIILTYTTRLR